MSEDDYKAKIATELVDDKFGGSLPEFIRIVTAKSGLSANDKEQLKKLL